MTQEQHRCAERVFTGRRDDFGGHPCQRKGTVERHGKWWCKQHDPEAAAEREAARRAKWQAEEDAKQAILDASRRLIDRLGVGTPGYSWGAGTYTGGVELTAEEAERLIARLEAAE